ncbi:MAG: pyridoxamine 5'-phosphate oxidase family protein [Actinomycetota bacterium]
MTDPIRDRPHAPAGYGFSTKPEGMLAWDRVREALGAAQVYFVATVAPNGAPYVTPIWGSWVGDHLYFEGGDDTRWSRNLQAEPRIGFGTVSNGLHINGRGKVERSPAGAEFGAVADNYAGKYGYRPTTDDYRRVSPQVVIALAMDSLEDFAKTPTRFRFQ